MESNNISNSQKGFFRGWLVVFAGLILMISVYGIVNNCASLFIKPVTEDLGFSRSEFSLYYTVIALSTMVIALFMGKLAKKFKLKNIILVGCVLAGIGYIGYSYASSIYVFYLMSIFSGLGLGMTTLTPLSIIISNWFVEKRGLALGLTFMGSGVGGMIFNPIANYIILNYSWRQSYLVLGIIILVTTIPVVLIFMSEKPSDKGLLPYGYSNSSENVLDNSVKGIMLGDAIKTKIFWIMVVGLILITIIAMGVQMHIASYLTDIGYSPTFAASVISINMGVVILGKILLGYVFDKVGCEKGVIFVGLQVFLGVLALLFASKYPAIIVFIICWGIGNCMGTIVPALITSEIFGKRDYSTIVGVVNAVVLLGAALGSAVTGKLYDMSGGYTLAWMTYLVLTVIMVGLILISLVLGKKKKLKEV
ncbi:MULTISPECIES: MFS transporter [Clostridioides]|uniref:MFS transporter n=1 Tax=Clostridioides sp. ZZV14-6387 TaxID=2811497 RepID=UPI0007BB4B40|nr:MFS transporter [Clostridioides sp. ZZV14-6387]CZR98278.1 putative MFS-type transporter YhjX [Clostridioides difficile]CZS04283.1 putative MFS-type transporter YhjX [Clostridioides difficile]